MSIILNNGVSNVKQTPAIIADVLSELPISNSVAPGTLFIDISTKQILRAESGGWVTYGTGFASDLQSVLNAGNLATDTAIELYDTPTTYRLYLTAAFLQWLETSSGAQQYLYPAPAFNNQIVYFPNDNGTLALTQTKFIGTINSTPFTINGGDNNAVYRIAAGAISIVLNPSNWIDRNTVALCFDITAVTISVTGGATLKGLPVINVAGLYYITYLQAFNTFYLSHTA